MKRTTRISWAKKTWNPVHGCTTKSEGCLNCYALLLTYNKEHGESEDGKGVPFRGMGLTYMGKDGKPRWTGNIVLATKPKVLNAPLSWKTPSLIFGNSMYDLFHEQMRLEWIKKILSVCRLADWHYFQFLTKRSDRMLELDSEIDWPPNVIMGVSVENDRWVHRLDDLRAVGARKKYVSLEPLIGSVPSIDLRGIDQAIIGGESGPNFRPMELEWVEEIKEKCREAGSAFYMKQDANSKAGEQGRFAERPDLWLHEWPEPEPDQDQFASLIEGMRAEKGEEWNAPKIAATPGGRGEAMSILDTSALPAETVETLAPAIEWLNKRLSRYCTSELHSFTVVSATNRNWYDRSKPSKASGCNYAPAVYFHDYSYPYRLTPKTGTSTDRATGDWEFTLGELSLAGPDEQLVFSAACTAFFWLRRTSQIPTSTYGRAAETSAHKCGSDWLEVYRRRTLPGMGRRAAIMAQRAGRGALSKPA